MFDSCDPMDCSLPGSSVHEDSPGKNTGVGCHFLLQGIFPTQGLNLDLLHCRQILYYLSHQRNQNCNAMDCSPPGSSVRGIVQERILEWVAISSSKESSQPRMEPVSPVSSMLAGGFLTTEPPVLLFNSN